MKESVVVDMILERLSPADLQIILDEGIDKIYPSGRTALGIAIDYLVEESVYQLLKNGANPNVYGDEANPPIYDAFISYSPRILILLLMYGANPDLKRHGLKKEDFPYSPKQVLDELGMESFFEYIFTLGENRATSEI